MLDQLQRNIKINTKKSNNLIKYQGLIETNKPSKYAMFGKIINKIEP